MQTIFISSKLSNIEGVKLLTEELSQEIFFLIFSHLFFAGMDENETITASPSSKGRETVVKTINVSRKLKKTCFS